MIRNCLAAFALCALVLPIGASAQSDPQTYTDPAMSYTAPSDFTPIPVPSAGPTGFQGPTAVAIFARHAKRPDAVLISVTMQMTDEDLSDYEADSEALVRNQGSGDNSVFIKKKLTTLSNGMPAYFMDVTVSQDSGELRIFQYVWVDGERGVVLAAVGRFGMIDDKSAMKYLSTASAVEYPKNRF